MVSLRRNHLGKNHFINDFFKKKDYVIIITEITFIQI
jgi:hypothetical protein